MIKKHKLKPFNLSADQDEIKKFSALADEWWNPEGSFWTLHKLNPARLKFIRNQTCNHFDRVVNKPNPLDGLRFADIGCGGGLLSEPIARLGAKVTGVDASERNVMVARDHAKRMGLNINYQLATVEQMANACEQYDVIVNMEVVEHVANVENFLTTSCQLLAPGGIMFLSTINRTFKSFAFAIIGAEYFLRWLPRGTHDWQRFVRPSEIATALRQGGLTQISFVGLSFNPLRDSWQIDNCDISVNYMATAKRP